MTFLSPTEDQNREKDRISPKSECMSHDILERLHPLLLKNLDCEVNSMLHQAGFPLCWYRFFFYFPDGCEITRKTLYFS